MHSTFKIDTRQKLIAVPVKGEKVDDHFGHCELFLLFKINDQNEIASTISMDSPLGCGCKSNLTELLVAQGVTHLLAGNMGEGAIRKIRDAGIQVTRGCTGNAADVVHLFLGGKLTDSGITCAHHNHGESHVCNH